MMIPLLLVGIGLCGIHTIAYTKLRSDSGNSKVGDRILMYSLATFSALEPIEYAVFRDAKYVQKSMLSLAKPSSTLPFLLTVSLA